MQPVWSLSVDLQTKTATFQSGMADAAKSARNAFTDIKQGSEGMADGVSYNMMEARHGVMLLGEEFGVHMPRALVSFISQLGPVSAAMEAAFPFLAIIVGATLLLEHLSKLKEKGEELTASQANFGTVAANGLNKLSDKLLEAQIKTDELAGHNMAALQKKLEQIDHQSMAELVQSFAEVSKAADDVLKKMEKSWYQFGSGSAEAMASLKKFKQDYDALLAHRDNDGASKLLHERVADEERILKLQKEAAQYSGDVYKNKGTDEGKAAWLQLQKEGKTYDADAIESHRQVLDALNQQLVLERANAEVKSAQKGNIKTETGRKMTGEQDAKDNKAAEAIAEDIEKRGKAWQRGIDQQVKALEEGEREKIDATHKGSAERLSAMDAAILAEQRMGLKGTDAYNSMLHERANLAQSIEEEKTASEVRAADKTLQFEMDAAKRAAQAEMESAHHLLAIHRSTAAEAEAQETQAQNELLAAEESALNKRIAALDRADAKQLQKIQEFEIRKKELQQQSANEVVKIQDAAEARRVATVQAAQQRMAEAAASTAARSIVSGQNMAQAFARMGDSMLQTALQNLMQMETLDGRKRLGNARTAATDAWKTAGNPILGAIEAGLTFAAVMAFEKGGIVPGVGHMDSVNAVLTPGEAVLPRGLTQLLLTAAKSGDGKFGGGGGDTHIHIHSSPTVHALDSEGMSRVLDKHSDTLAQHFNNHIRKMNR